MKAGSHKKSVSWSEVVIEHTPEFREALDNFLFEKGALALVHEETSDRMICRAGFGSEKPAGETKKDLEGFLNELAGIFDLRPSHSIKWRSVFEDTWSEEWKRDLGPLEVGSGLIIKPSWLDNKSWTDRIILNLDPGLAFGTGLHASTRFCLDALAEYLAFPENAEARILDVGTGSGILAMASAALGRGFVLAIDNDPRVLPVAVQNLENNGLAGSVALACADPASIKGQFDLILANLFSGELIRLAPTLGSLGADGGKLILSGILKHQAKAVANSFTSTGFILTEHRNEGEWAALVLTKPS